MKKCFPCKDLQVDKFEIPEERLPDIVAETDEKRSLALVVIFTGDAIDETGFGVEAGNELAEFVCG